MPITQHERRAGEIVKEEHPEALVSLSSDVAAVIPRNMKQHDDQSKFLRHVGDVFLCIPPRTARSGARNSSAVDVDEIERRGCKRPRHSSTPRGDRPVRARLPGIVGANFIGDSVGMHDLICIDIGEPPPIFRSLKTVAPGLTNRGRIGNWPIGLPMVDCNDGWCRWRLDREGFAHRRHDGGPESAGAKPGPVCYRRGGVEPCVTDAHLVLGHLPAFLLDGSFELDIDGARDAIKSRIADPLGVSIEDAARGILAIADNNMVGAIRIVSIERASTPASSFSFFWRRGAHAWWFHREAHGNQNDPDSAGARRLVGLGPFSLGSQGGVLQIIASKG